MPNVINAYKKLTYDEANAQNGDAHVRICERFDQMPNAHDQLVLFACFVNKFARGQSGVVG